MTTRLFAAIALLSAAATLSAQQYKYLVTVATFKVAPGKENAFVDRGKVVTPVLDRLMTSGTVLAYGMDVDLLHVPGENNVAFWAVVPNYEALEKEETAIQDYEKAHPAFMQDLMSMSDPSTHHDLLIRCREENHKAVPAAAKPIGDFDIDRVKPGRMNEYLGVFRKYDKPVLDKLVADGVIYAYEIDTEAIHTMEPGLVWTILTLPDLAARDKVAAAFDEAEKNLPEVERNLLEKLYLDLVVPGAHRDSLTRSVVFKQK